MASPQSNGAAPASAAASAAPAAPDPTLALPSPATVHSLLLHLLSLQSRRALAYSELHEGFRSFLAAREALEAAEEEATQQKARQSTVLVKSDDKGPTPASAAPALPAEVNVTPAERETLESIATANARAEAAAPPNPERVFQELCARIMREFQMQLEKRKLELCVQGQLLRNHQYVLAHPRAHGQLREHHHHSHDTTTDCQGRVLKKKKKRLALEGVAEEGEDEEKDDDAAESDEDAELRQEIEDNRQPFTRHLSNLLSQSALHADSPFLFHPSGAAPPEFQPEPLQPLDHTHPDLDEKARQAFEDQLRELRAQEGELVQAINEILEEVKMETMDGEDVDEGEEADGD